MKLNNEQRKHIIACRRERLAKQQQRLVIAKQMRLKLRQTEQSENA